MYHLYITFRYRYLYIYRHPYVYIYIFTFNASIKSWIKLNVVVYIHANDSNNMNLMFQ